MPGGHPAKFAPDERFAYSNSGYVVLALIAERVSGVPFHDLVRLFAGIFSSVRRSCPILRPSHTVFASPCGRHVVCSGNLGGERVPVFSAIRGKRQSGREVWPPHAP